MSNFLNYQYSKAVNNIYKKETLVADKTLSDKDMEIRIKSCLKLALNIAKKYHAQIHNNFDLDDVVQVANEGLCIAARMYNNPEVKFSAYAYARVKKCVLEFLNVEARPLKVSFVEGFSRVTDDLAFISKDSFTNYNDESNDNPINNMLVSPYIDGIELADLNLANININKQLNTIMSCLDETERHIVCAKFGLAPYHHEFTDKEIHKMWFAIKEKDIPNIIAKSIIKLKQYAEDNNIDIEKLLYDAKSVSKHKDLVTNNDAKISYDNCERYNDCCNAISWFAKYSDIDEIELEKAIFIDEKPIYKFVKVQKCKDTNRTFEHAYTITRRVKTNGKIYVTETVTEINENGKLSSEPIQINVHHHNWLTHNNFAHWLWDKLNVKFAAVI